MRCNDPQGHFAIAKRASLPGVITLMDLCVNSKQGIQGTNNQILFVKSHQIMQNIL